MFLSPTPAVMAAEEDVGADTAGEVAVDTKSLRGALRLPLMRRPVRKTLAFPAQTTEAVVVAVDIVPTITPIADESFLVLWVCPLLCGQSVC